MKNKHLDANGELEVIYDFKYDILLFKIKERSYKVSIEFQNFVVDIDKEGFATGVRIFDASKVFNIDKYKLKNITVAELNTKIQNNIITIRLNFLSKVRNKIIPLIENKESFTQQIITKLGPKHFSDSSVESAIEA